MRFSLGKIFLAVQSITLFLILLDFSFSEQIFRLDTPWFISLSIIYPLIFFIGESFYLKPKLIFSFSKILKFGFKKILNSV